VQGFIGTCFGSYIRSRHQADKAAKNICHVHHMTLYYTVHVNCWDTNLHVVLQYKRTPSDVTLRCIHIEQQCQTDVDVCDTNSTSTMAVHLHSTVGVHTPIQQRTRDVYIHFITHFHEEQLAAKSGTENTRFYDIRHIRAIFFLLREVNIPFYLFCRSWLLILWLMF